MQTLPKLKPQTFPVVAKLAVFANGNHHLDELRPGHITMTCGLQFFRALPEEGMPGTDECINLKNGRG
jgi:hypothetical protein